MEPCQASYHVSLPIGRPARDKSFPSSRAVRVPWTYQLPDAGASATRIPPSDEPTIPRLVASPAMLPILLFGRGSVIPLAILSADLGSSLPRPYARAVRRPGIHQWMATPEFGRSRFNWVCRPRRSQKRTCGVLGIHDDPGPKTTKSRTYGDLLLVCSNGIGRLRGFPRARE
jgi:hypothetical protein